MRSKQLILEDLKNAREDRDLAYGFFKTKDEVVNGLEEELMASMNEDGLSSVTGSGLTATIGKSIVPMAKDWPALYNHIHRKKAYHLLERRVHTTAWREEVEKGKPIPGVEGYERIKLTVKTKD